MIVLSHYQTRPLIRARGESTSSASVSLDLGISLTTASWDDASICFPEFPDAPHLTWHDARKIIESQNGCFTLGANGITKIQTFSEETNRPISLYPTPSAPTMLIGGIPMHRVKDTNPILDTLAKIETIAPVRGRVLDTCMGLGYTAIQAAKTAEHVVSIEHDPAVVEIAKANPWSRDLFANPRIERILGDSAERVRGFQGSAFDSVIHDPPMFSLAGELYSEEFYHELFRILTHGGRMFHYIGDLESKSGRNITRGVAERLTRAGFKRVAKRPEAFGVLALK